MPDDTTTVSLDLLSRVVVNKGRCTITVSHIADRIKSKRIWLLLKSLAFFFSALYSLKQDSDSALDSSHFYGREFMSCFDGWWICPLLIHFLSPLVTPTLVYQYPRISV
jgi:hypothetical protein